MAGRKKIDPNAPDNRGGARKGSGQKRKKISFDERDIRDLMKAVRKFEKESGKSINEILVGIIYAASFQGEKIKIRDRIEAIKLLKALTRTKTSEKNINLTVSPGPTIFLPSPRPDETQIKLVNNG